MIRGFDSGYAFARACGSLARGYLGDRASSLAKSARVAEAWRAIFGESPPALGEEELAAAADARLTHRPVEAFERIAGRLDLDEPFFAALLRKREFAYVKSLVSGIVEGSPEPPPVTGFSPSVNLPGYPDLERTFRGSRYQWLAESGLGELAAAKNRIDRQYFEELWASTATIKPNLVGTLPLLLRLEAELENLVWALRLKRYYSMGAEEIGPLLIGLKGCDVKSTALGALGLRADLRSEWDGWRWERLLDDGRREEGGEWHLDLRRFEAAARSYLFRKLYRRLHFELDSYVPLYAYFRIKEYETQAIQGIIEGIRLEAAAAEIGAFASATTGGAA
jgi:hypothetical protein